MGKRNLGKSKLGFGRTLHLKSPVEIATVKSIVSVQPKLLKKAHNCGLFCKPIVYEKEC